MKKSPDDYDEEEVKETGGDQVKQRGEEGEEGDDGDDEEEEK